MDMQLIDQQYQRLEAEAQQTIAALQTLGGKLQAAAQGGDQQAREWLLDLRELALSFRSEQEHVGALLQSVHGFVAEAAQAQNRTQQAMPAVSPQPMSPASGGMGGGWGVGGPAADPYQQPGYQGAVQPAPAGGMLGSFLSSGFGRAIEMGAGFGIGDDLINKIF